MHECVEASCGAGFWVWFLLKHDLLVTSIHALVPLLSGTSQSMYVWQSPFYSTFMYFRPDEENRIRSWKFSPLLLMSWVVTARRFEDAAGGR